MLKELAETIDNSDSFKQVIFCLLLMALRDKHEIAWLTICSFYYRAVAISRKYSQRVGGRGAEFFFVPPPPELGGLEKRTKRSIDNLLLIINPLPNLENLTMALHQIFLVQYVFEVLQTHIFDEKVPFPFFTTEILLLVLLYQFSLTGSFSYAKNRVKGRVPVDYFRMLFLLFLQPQLLLINYQAT